MTPRHQGDDTLVITSHCRYAPAVWIGLAAMFAIGVTSVLGQTNPKDKADIGGAVPGQKDFWFNQHIAPILEAHCVRCHNTTLRKGKLALDTQANILAGGAGGAVIVPGKPDNSELLWAVRGPDPEMPQKAKPLSKQQIADLEQWIKAGATWPKGLTLQDRPAVDLDWWSLRPLKRPVLPKLTPADQHRVATPIDAFVLARLRAKGLEPSPRADRRTLIRRLYFDLIGLPPTPAQINAFVGSKEPKAYEKLVDELLASPHYGERWARHWLDVVHYGDTHGYDKDKPRPNAWPYRDYVIRSFNDDKPFSRFVREQIAGDVLWPNTVDGIVATGFLAAGPWDFIGHAEVPESKIDGKVARHVDRDDMVRTVFETFTSTTVGCAQCHHHKFDPVTMEDYYSLHAVFAALDRADREYDVNQKVAAQRVKLLTSKSETESELDTTNKAIQKLGGAKLAEINKRIAALNKAQAVGNSAKPEFGYHSRIEKSPDVHKWVQVDLGKPVALDEVMIVGCHDTFNNIGAGFGFPVRFKIELSDDPQFKKGVKVIADRTADDFANPKVAPLRFAVNGMKGRFIRVTATKLVNRLPNDYIFALAELSAFTSNGENVAAGRIVTSLDSIQAPVRWRRSNLVDGYYFGVDSKDHSQAFDKLTRERKALLAKVTPPPLLARQVELGQSLAETEAAIKALPIKGKVYAGCVHHGKGNFRGRGGLGPREIRYLQRGQVTKPGRVMSPGVPNIIPAINPRFALPDNHSEGERRAALADWLVRKDHPLTWRSIVNRVWLYHFGRGIADSPGDFGRMGRLPTHPQLLDWLAVEFRDGGQSLKQLHRLIVLSATYQQVSNGHTRNEQRDADNQFLWRMNRRQLDAEAIRDTVLFVAGKLNRKMGGPAFRDFVLEKPQHSPHYKYGKYDPDDASTHRRSVYRFIVRSQPQPFMDTLDCADPSQLVAKRNRTLTALQALALLNNRFILRMCEHAAARLKLKHKTLEAQVNAAFNASIGRLPDEYERKALIAFAQKHGLANACRVILNMNEFVFVD